MRTDPGILTGTIHPTALIAPGAKIGKDVTVGPYTLIGENVTIGDGTSIGSHNVIDGWTKIGARCKIMHSTCVGVEPQDLKYRGAESLVEIGDDNTVREFVTIHRATERDEVTRIGNHNLLMAYVHIAHNCVVGNHTILANAVNLAGHVIVEDNASVGGVTPVHQFVRIGGHAFIGGGSRVAQDVPPYLLAAGNPLRVVGINQVGLERRNFPAETRAALRKAYKILYRSEKNTLQALEAMRAELLDLPEIRHLLRFIETSERGIT
ncbi:MAG: acyl-ACP--UDP-N-acetylglucosamine O-acyltransferase [Candidatus Eisenbacteria bacterium]